MMLLRQLNIKHPVYSGCREVFCDIVEIPPELSMIGVWEPKERGWERNLAEILQFPGEFETLRQVIYRNLYRKSKRGHYKNPEQLYIAVLNENLSSWSAFDHGMFSRLQENVNRILILSNFNKKFIQIYNKKTGSSWESVSDCLQDLQKWFFRVEKWYWKEIWKECQQVWDEWETVKENRKQYDKEKAKIQSSRS